MRRYSTFPIALFLTLSLSFVVRAEPKRSVGFAISNVPFEVSGSKVERNATILEGETLQSGEFPAQLNLSSGSRFILGIDSQVKVLTDRVVLQGGSVRLTEVGNSSSAMEAAGLTFVPRDAASTATLYMSDSNVLSASVAAGAVSVFTKSGSKIKEMAAGDAMTFTDQRGDSERAPMEIAKVQAKQLETLRKAHEDIPGFGKKAGVWPGALAAASGGVIAAGGSDPAALTPALGESVSVNNAALQRATLEVGREILAGSLEEEGCGNGCPPNSLITNNYQFCFIIFGFGCL